MELMPPAGEAVLPHCELEEFVEMWDWLVVTVWEHSWVHTILLLHADTVGVNDLAIDDDTALRVEPGLGIQTDVVNNGVAGQGVKVVDAARFWGRGREKWVIVPLEASGKVSWRGRPRVRRFAAGFTMVYPAVK